MKLPTITNVEQLEALIDKIGLLPFFRCPIKGYSLQECTPATHWFVDGVDGPWQWREEIASKGKIAYAKLFNKKAGFVSMEWYPDVSNYRRGGYDFTSRYESGLASRPSKMIMDCLRKNGPLLTTQLKHMTGLKGKDNKSIFESALTALQMQTYITAKEFVYKRDFNGEPYGWGVGRYIIMEDYYGEDTLFDRYGKEPFDSQGEIIQHISTLFPETDRHEILKLIK